MTPTTTPKFNRLTQTITVCKLIAREGRPSMLRWLILLTIAEHTDETGQPAPIDIQELSFKIGKTQHTLCATMADEGLIKSHMAKYSLTAAGIAEVRRIIEGRMPGETSNPGPPIDMSRVRSFVGHIAKEDKV